MQTINSSENKVYKNCIKLKEKKYRDREGQYLIEGENLVAEAFAQDVDIVSVILREGMPAREHAVTMGASLFDRISSVETSQGVLAVVRKRRWTPQAVFAGNVAVLDRLQDPGNVGTVIRTAEAAGYSGILIMKGCADPYGPKAVRAAAGSVFRMPMLAMEDPEQALAEIRKHGRQITVADSSGNTDFRDRALAENIALIIGNEGNGPAQAFLQNADHTVCIPMRGRVESLNASVAAAIIMYQSINIEGEVK